MALKETRLEVIDKMSRAELKQAIVMCFERAQEVTPIDRLAVLQEAQFYTQELERRSDSRTSIRDFVLEIAVIALIGWEIHMGYRAERLQTTNFGEEKKVFEHLDKSSGATAETLVAVKDSINAMKTAVQNQLALSYEPSIIVKFEPTRRLNIINGGRTSITLWGDKQGNDAPYFLKAPHVMAINAGYEFDATPLYTQLEQRVPKGSSYTFPLQIYIKNELGAEFIVHATLTGVWEEDRVRIFTQVNSILRSQWDLY